MKLEKENEDLKERLSKMLIEKDKYKEQAMVNVSLFKNWLLK